MHRTRGRIQRCGDSRARPVARAYACMYINSCSTAIVHYSYPFTAHMSTRTCSVPLRHEWVDLYWVNTFRPAHKPSQIATFRNESPRSVLAVWTCACRRRFRHAFVTGRENRTRHGKTGRKDRERAPCTRAAGGGDVRTHGVDVVRQERAAGTQQR